MATFIFNRQIFRSNVDLIRTIDLRIDKWTILISLRKMGCMVK
jgi:hypothetical protein